MWRFILLKSENFKKVPPNTQKWPIDHRKETLFAPLCAIFWHRLTRNQFFLGVLISFPKITPVAGTPICSVLTTITITITITPKRSAIYKVLSRFFLMLHFSEVLSKNILCKKKQERPFGTPLNYFFTLKKPLLCLVFICYLCTSSNSASCTVLSSLAVFCAVPLVASCCCCWAA